VKSNIKEIINQQFGAAVKMLNNANADCPEELWKNRALQPEFWCVAYHFLFWLDFYLSESPDDFKPPSPFTISEFDPKGVLPERIYTKEELLNYLKQSRLKLKATIDSLTDEKAKKRFIFGTLDLSLLELIFYNMRHVQHHTAQLNLILRQKTDSAPRWIRRAE